MKLEDFADDADTCRGCGAPLPQDKYWGRRTCCSPRCQHRVWANRVYGERTCETCGRTFPMLKGTDHYCSLACYHEALRRIEGEPVHLARARERKRCEYPAAR